MRKGARTWTRGTRVSLVPPLLFALSLFALPFLRSGCRSPTPPPAHPDVVLVTVDTLRADHVGLYGYERPTTPAVDRWFGGGAIYERAYSTHAATPQSVVSILSGLLPQEHRVRLFYQLAPPELRLLPDLLRPRYRTAAFVANMLLTEEALGIAGRFDHYDDYVDQLQHNRDIYERNAERTTDAVLRWLERENDPGRPLFLWVHYMDPHGPYHPPADWKFRFRHSGRREIDPNRVSAYMRIPGETDGLVYVDRYDEEIAYTDFHLGRLFEGYEKIRPVEKSLWIFTADHGETMMEHEFWFTHGYHVYEPIVRVPLLLRGPGVVPGRKTALASGTDIAPTVLRFAGVESPPELPRVDLRTGEGLSANRVVYAEARGLLQQRAAVAARRKWVVSLEPGTGKIVSKRTYDLEHDPGESAPEPWQDGPAGESLLELCRSDPDPGGAPVQVRKGTKLTAPKIAPRAEAEVRERLRALGYEEEP
ncbi:MAG: hypothetical protein KatS3mg076_2040 [Candidatus Binatia bacterium]|nr:MAG: hypothetical protein KatS3mg076_2040 [Candidatus Binatia bacterium]